MQCVCNAVCRVRTVLEWSCQPSLQAWQAQQPVYPEERRALRWPSLSCICPMFHHLQAGVVRLMSKQPGLWVIVETRSYFDHRSGSRDNAIDSMGIETALVAGYSCLC